MAKRTIAKIARPRTLARRADQLLGELRQMIDSARARVATAANSELTLLYWRIGRRIHSEILSGERAAYGEGNSCHGVATIGSRIRPGIHLHLADAHGRLFRGVSSKRRLLRRCRNNCRGPTSRSCCR